MNEIAGGLNMQVASKQNTSITALQANKKKIELRIDRV